MADIGLLHCSQCDHQQATKPQHIGRRVKCPSCNAATIIIAEPTEPDPEEGDDYDDDIAGSTDTYLPLPTPPPEWVEPTDFKSPQFISERADPDDPEDEYAEEGVEFDVVTASDETPDFELRDFRGLTFIANGLQGLSFFMFVLTAFVGVSFIVVLATMANRRGQFLYMLVYGLTLVVSGIVSAALIRAAGEVLQAVRHIARDVQLATILLQRHES